MILFKILLIESSQKVLAKYYSEQRSLFSVNVRENSNDIWKTLFTRKVLGMLEAILKSYGKSLTRGGGDSAPSQDLKRVLKVS